MLRNYLKIALRNVLRDKVFSSINLIGLAVGIGCCVAIMLYVRDESSYDRFNANADRIYRPVLHGLINNHEINSPFSPAAMGPALARDLPDVAAYTRIRSFKTPVIRYGDKAFSEKRFYWVDSTFFDVFTVKFIEGDPRTALTRPNTVVITEATARKYFGNSDAMGKILNADNDRDYVVTGVVEDFPPDSHFHFDFLGSLSTYADSRNPFWLSSNYYTYVLLRQGTDPVRFQNELRDEFRRYAGPQLKQSLGVSLDQFEAAGNRFGFNLQSLTSIHLHSHLDGELEPNGDISYVYIFSAIAMAILLVACINFINLATARSERRSKEVGIRKTLGSDRLRLVSQFMSESVLMSVLAVVLAVGFVELLLPFFNDIAGKEMSLNLFDGFATIPILVCFAVFVGLAAGVYPAFRLSSHEPARVLKSGTRTGDSKVPLRSGLVVFQFAISIALLIGTFVMYEQMKYIQNKNLGFDKEQVIVINRTNDLGNRIASFKQELLANSKIISASNSTAIPGSQDGASVFWVKGTHVQRPQGMKEMWTDYDFMKTFRMKLAAGRFFSEDHPSDTASVVVNQAAEKVLSVRDLVGKVLLTPGRSAATAKSFDVVGVVKNFNFESLHQTIQPLVIHLLPYGSAGSFMSIRVAPGGYSGTVSSLETAWKKYAGSEAFDYSFLDQRLAHLYVVEQRMGSIVTTFSILAIFVACLGLLGLAAFVTERRTKEIGIRKVLGASVLEITFLLSREFTKWVLLANILAWPAAYFIMSNWLDDFAYRINISPWTFALSGAMALIVALLTVSSQAIKAATANPVKSLRYE